MGCGSSKVEVQNAGGDGGDGDAGSKADDATDEIINAVSVEGDAGVEDLEGDGDEGRYGCIYVVAHTSYALLQSPVVSEMQISDWSVFAPCRHIVCTCAKSISRRKRFPATSIALCFQQNAIKDLQLPET